MSKPTTSEGDEATGSDPGLVDEVDETDDLDDEDDDDFDDVADDEPPAASGLSWPRVIVLGAALAFLGLAVGLFVTRDRSPGADSVDVGFYQDMLYHHEQALEMALSELANGTNPTVRSYAMELLIQQSREMGIMDRMLQEWGFSRAQESEPAMTWMDMEVPRDQMPGLASQEELDQLANSEGEAADTLFLELMAEHHAGGLHMAEYAAEHASDKDVRKRAERIAYNQAVEINEYAVTAERLGLPANIERVDVPARPST